MNAYIAKMGKPRRLAKPKQPVEKWGVLAINGEHEWEVTYRIWTETEAKAIAADFAPDGRAAGTTYHPQRYLVTKGGTP